MKWMFLVRPEPNSSSCDQQQLQLSLIKAVTFYKRYVSADISWGFQSWLGRERQKEKEKTKQSASLYRLEYKSKF